MIWLFDYDLTLYGRDEYEVLERLDRNITRFLQRRFQLEASAADERRRDYFRRFGTTLAGLRALDGVAPSEYFDFIHDGADLLLPKPNPNLADRLRTLAGRAWVFTNARRDWADRGLQSIGIADCFQGILDIETFAWKSKPDPTIYPIVENRVRKGKEPIVLLDDRPDNLAPAQALGWRTVLVNPADEVHSGLWDLCVRNLAEVWDRAPREWFLYAEEMPPEMESGSSL